MRKTLPVFLLLGILLTLSGCAPEAQPQPGSLSGSAPDETPVMTEIDAWPENEYTEAIFPPEAGEPFYTLSDAQGGMFSIFYQNITREQGEQYVDALCADGFTALEKDANAVSVGQLLEKDGVILSIALSEGVLGISIFAPQDM